MRLPIFPLNTVIFPRGCMPLRIFEARYLDMVKHCVKENSSFVVCLIRSGREVSAPASFYPLGTECEITDWETTPEGLLGITVVGRHRVEVSSPQIAPDNLITADIVRTEEMPDQPLPDSFGEWRDLLRQIMQKLGSPFTDLQADYESADWVGARLIEYLPIELAKKQQLLRLDHPLVRLEHLNDCLEDIEYYQKAGKFRPQ